MASRAVESPLPAWRTWPWQHQQKSPARAGLFVFFGSGALRGLLLDVLDLFGRLAAAGRLGEALLDELQGLGLGDLVDRRDLAHDPIEGRLVELALAVGLLRLRLRAVEIADHLGDGDEVARIDLRLVLLSAPRPHGALDARAARQHLEALLDEVRLGELAHADARRLGGRDTQNHLVLLERHDEQLELEARDLLLLDRRDAADAVSRVDDRLARLETLTLSCLLGCHTRRASCLDPFPRTTRRRGGIQEGQISSSADLWIHRPSLYSRLQRTPVGPRTWIFAYPCPWPCRSDHLVDRLNAGSERAGRNRRQQRP